MNRCKKTTISICVLLTVFNIVACGQVKEDEPVSAEESAVNEQENSGQMLESINTETTNFVNDSYYLLEEYRLSIEDFWKTEDIGSEKDDAEKGVKFATGLEIVYPDTWQGKVVLETDVNVLAVCEKGNADAGIGGDLFYLCFYEHENDTVVLYDWDKVLGVYQQGSKEYVLVQDFPGDRCYSEDDQLLIDAYMELQNTINDVEVKTDDMAGYLECGIEDLDWVQYEGDWE